MATFYVREGATYNGNGTASNAAASAGASGAYNSVIECLKQTTGYTVSDGDTVYIKTTNESSANFTITISAAQTWFKGSATVGVTWIFDDGTVWSGAGGTITFSLTTASFNITANPNNHLIGKNSNVVFDNQYNTNSGLILTGGIGLCEGVLCKLEQSTRNPSFSWIGGTVKNLKIRSAARYVNAISLPANYETIHFVNLEIEVIQSGGSALINSMIRNGLMVFLGGRVYGTYANNATTLFSLGSTEGGKVFLDGFTYPKEMPNSFGSTSIASIYGNFIDGKLAGYYENRYIAFDSRNDGYYPTLNATLPDSAQTPWSYKVTRSSYLSKIRPQQLAINKLWTQAAAQKVITLELLSNDSDTTPTSDVVWLDVVYTNSSTGLLVCQTTRTEDATTLSTSTASWSATTYGAYSFTKRKISLTTTASIKQDTVVQILVWFAIPQTDIARVSFLDPDPVFSTP